MIWIMPIHTILDKVLCQLVNKLSSFRGAIDWFDCEQFPVVRGELSWWPSVFYSTHLWFCLPVKLSNILLQLVPGKAR